MSPGWAALAWLAAALAAPSPPGPAAFDPVASRAEFRVDLRLSGPVDGRFEAIDGDLEAAGGGRLRVRVRVDARRLSLDGPDWMARAMASDRYLDVRRHPRLHFDSDPFPPGLLVRGGELAGDLQLRGRSRPVRFRVEPSACGRPGLDCEIRVRGRISRRDFDMRAHRFLVRDPVEFEFSVRLRESAPP